MTFQAAQAEFSAIVGRVASPMASADLLKLQQELLALQNRLPASAEFDVIADAIAEFSPKLTGQIVHAVLQSLTSRASTIKEAADLLTRVGNKAKADARVLTLEQPKLLAIGLNEAVGKIQELRNSAKAGDFEQTASKIDALATLVQHLRGTIKTA